MHSLWLSFPFKEIVLVRVIYGTVYATSFEAHGLTSGVMEFMFLSNTAAVFSTRINIQTYIKWRALDWKMIGRSWTCCLADKNGGTVNCLSTVYERTTTQIVLYKSCWNLHARRLSTSNIRPSYTSLELWAWFVYKSDELYAKSKSREILNAFNQNRCTMCLGLNIQSKQKQIKIY